MSIYKELSKNMINLPRYAKKTMAIITDVGLCILTTWLAFYLRLEQFEKSENLF